MTHGMTKSTMYTLKKLITFLGPLLNIWTKTGIIDLRHPGMYA